MQGVDKPLPPTHTFLTVSTALVIVESPAKARTIAGFLGDGYIVESSIGHVRDLPRNAAEVPESHKGEKWARIGIDVDNDFKPLYVVNADKKSHLKHLRDLLKQADELYRGLGISHRRGSWADRFDAAVGIDQDGTDHG